MDTAADRVGITVVVQVECAVDGAALPGERGELNMVYAGERREVHLSDTASNDGGCAGNDVEVHWGRIEVWAAHGNAQGATVVVDEALSVLESVRKGLKRIGKGIGKGLKMMPWLEKT